MREIPKKYRHGELEETWRQRWDELGAYEWDPRGDRAKGFVIDTPPPTVSGSLHVGHAFSYTHQDLLARYQRMRGKNVAYPMGWDDNGLPTERRVQNVFGVRPEPRLPYDADWKPRRDKQEGEEIEEISRRNFIELCGLLTEEDEKAFEHTWRRLGLSIDWSLTYATIDATSRRMAQLSFLDLYRKGRVYQATAPTMWDTDFRTAVAQAEVEDRPRRGFFHDLRFAVEGGGDLVISTTRPELLAACIAVVAHPDDERYASLFGKTAITPLFEVPVPILPATHADPEKGTGILMVCTFGDLHDVEFWKGSELPLRQLIGRDGKLGAADFGSAPFASRDARRANAVYGELQGLYVNQARRRMVDMLAEEDSFPGGGRALVGEPRATEQNVRFYEKGDRPLEFVTTRQWFVRILDCKDELLEQGRKIAWHPEHMRARYEHWVEGLNQDWCISRQRYSGVAFPVWYPIGDDGELDYEAPILAADQGLPIDPLSTAPPGYADDQRDRPGGFAGDPDVMDTWATSSLTPQIITGWVDAPERHERMFPMDLRPQSHEIIRTWAFYTIVKAWMHEDEIPWRHITISGWVVDPDRKKMSKSKGNVVTPVNIFEEYSADAFRYWAARNRFGTDTIFDPDVIRLGKRLTTKLFNASRFVSSQLDRAAAHGLGPERIRERVDLAYVGRLRDLVERCTEGFEDFDYSGPLHALEEHFWEFCDDYLELVKGRSYSDDASPGRDSALATLRLSLGVYLRLFAPYLPFVTEEIWSWRFAADDGIGGSIHRSSWPDERDFAGVAERPPSTAFLAAAAVLQQIRGAKTQAKRSLRWPVEELRVIVTPAVAEALRPALADVVQAGSVDEGGVVLESSAGGDEESPQVSVRLASEDRVREQKAAERGSD